MPDEKEESQDGPEASPSQIEPSFGPRADAFPASHGMRAIRSGYLCLLRVAAIAHVTLREAVRQKVLGVLVLLAAGGVLGALALREFNFGAPELKFVVELGLGAIGFFGAVTTVVMTVQLFFSELEQRTLHTVLARPVSRAELIAGKFLAVAMLTAAFCVVLTTLLALLVWRREAALMRAFPEAFGAGQGVRYWWLAASGVLLWFKLTVLGAFTLLVASYARGPLFAVTMGLLIWMVCHLHALARHAASPVARLMSCVLPDFAAFVPAGEADGLWPGVASLGAYAFGYVLAGCALAAFSFKHREI